MKRAEELKKHMKRGKVYRREDLAAWSKSIDRHLGVLVEDGTLQKVGPGLYSYPKQSVYGQTPPDEKELVKSFLKDDRFLLTSPNAYNSLGVGTTQLYNTRTVYNHKRKGEIKLGNRTFNFVNRHHFPDKLTEEFLVVDLVNNLEMLAEDSTQIMSQLKVKVELMDKKKLKKSLTAYGNNKAKKLLSPLL
jgi:hypothetical protein